MYLNFFNFSEEPFTITPNPKFLFLSKQHEEAIECVMYGIESRKGYMALIGDVGTGKTTACREIINRLDKNIDTAMILNPMLSVYELLEAINDDFGNKTATADSLKGQLDALNKFLLRRLRWDKNAVVIIDEAQNLSVEALEMVRMLSNIETEDKKLLQILLIGQPELKRTLDQPELRQLNQRIGIRYFLGALSYIETCDYISHRIFVAGGAASVQFEEKALKEIYEYSNGIPRLINILCDRALLEAYAEKKRVINTRIIKQSISDIEGKSNAAGVYAVEGKKKSWFRWLYS